jgi:hypothetical protein
MASFNYKVTKITSNTVRDFVGFYEGAKLIRIVSVVKELAITTDGLKIQLQSNGLSVFEFDVINLEDIDGTIYTLLPASSGAAGAKYVERLSVIMDKLFDVFRGCCSDSGGTGTPIQIQNDGVAVGTPGQYTTYNFTGNATVTETSPDVVEIEVVSSATGQADIQFQEEGANLGGAGTVDTVNVVGDLHKASRAGNTVTHTAPSAGENLQMTSLDPANPLNVKIGCLSPNVVSWTATGKQNNLALSGWNDAWVASSGSGKATTIEYSGSAYSILSGVVGGASGRVMIISNLSNKLVIVESESADSSASNRFRTNDGIAIFIMPNESQLFLYADSRWNMMSYQRWNVFDDFSGFSGATSQATNTFYVSGISTTSSGLSSQQNGLISMQPTAGARAYTLANWNGAYSVGGTSTPSLCISRIALSSSVSTFGRVALGYGGMAASAGNFYTSGTGVCNGAVWGFATDSGIANATTNWFIYSGIGGAADMLVFGLDSGIPISNCVNNYNNFAVYFDLVNSVFEFFYSQNGGIYQYVGSRTRAPSSGLPAIWYEATNASRPTMWIDYTGVKTKIVSNR